MGLFEQLILGAPPATAAAAADSQTKGPPYAGLPAKLGSDVYTAACVELLDDILDGDLPRRHGGTSDLSRLSKQAKDLAIAVTDAASRLAGYIGRMQDAAARERALDELRRRNVLLYNLVRYSQDRLFGNALARVKALEAMQVAPAAVPTLAQLAERQSNQEASAGKSDGVDVADIRRRQARRVRVDAD